MRTASEWLPPWWLPPWWLPIATLPTLALGLPWVVCRDPKCPKNHIRYFKNRQGHHAELVCVHYKNSNTKGIQTIPLSKALLEKFVLLEQGVDALFGGSSRNKVLLCAQDGSTFNPKYWSTAITNMMAIEQERYTPTAMRHMFATHFRDFMSSPTMRAAVQPNTEATAAAASMMLNSTTAWDMAYDDSTYDRHAKAILSIWPKFQEFVHEVHLDKKSEEAWDPLAMDLADLQL